MKKNMAEAYYALMSGKVVSFIGTPYEYTVLNGKLYCRENNNDKKGWGESCNTHFIGNEWSIKEHDHDTEDDELKHIKVLFAYLSNALNDIQDLQRLSTQEVIQARAWLSKKIYGDS